MKKIYFVFSFFLIFILNNCITINIPKNDDNRSYLLVKYQVPLDNLNQIYQDLIIGFYNKNNTKKEFKSIASNKYYFYELPQGNYIKYEVKNEYTYQHNLVKKYEKKGEYNYKNDIDLILENNCITIFPYYLSFGVTNAYYTVITLSHKNIGNYEMAEIINNLKKDKKIYKYSNFVIYNKTYDVNMKTDTIINDVNIQNKNILINFDLINGIFESNYDKVNNCLKNNADINFKDPRSGKTPIMYSIINGMMFKILLEHNPDIKIKDYNEKNLEYYVNEFNNSSVIKLFNEYKKKYE